MRKILLLLITIALFTLMGCGDDSNNNKTAPKNIETEIVEKSITEETKEELTAEGLLQEFRDGGMTIIDEITYTSSTDPNEKLGRPGEYIAKINFNDGNFSETWETPELSIEVFENEDDMIKRRDYIQGITDESDSNALKYYIYGYDVFLFRIPYKVTPEVAAEYEAIFYEYVK